jgi:hypothetical protein
MLTKAQQVYDDFEGAPNIDYGFINGVLDKTSTNPDQSGINTSATCGKYTRNSSETYDVILLEPTAVMNDLSDYLSGSKKMTIMVKTDVSVTVQITLENSILAQPTNHPTGRHSDYFATTTGSGNWELLTFDYEQQPDAGVLNDSVDRMVILFDPGKKTGDVYYMDEIMGPKFENPCANNGIIDSIAEDFDCNRNVTFDFANGTLNVIDNPNTDGDNMSNKCGQFIKWTTAKDGAFGGTLNTSFTTEDYVSAKIDLYTPNPSQKFLVSMQDEDNNQLSIDSIITRTSDNWETYSLDFSNISPSKSVEKFVFLLNPSTETEDTIYFDNFIFSKEFVSTSVQEKFEDLISIYPNPVQNNNQVIFELKKDGIVNSIEIISIDGKLMESLIINKNKTSVDLSHYARGSYIAKLILNNNTIITSRIIK